METLKRTGTVIEIAAKCGLGQAAPKALLSSLELFESEYRTLIAQRQQEYERCVKESSHSSDGRARDSARSIMDRIIPY